MEPQKQLKKLRNSLLQTGYNGLKDITSMRMVTRIVHRVSRKIVLSNKKDAQVVENVAGASVADN